MPNLLLKLVVTPAVLAAATLSGRRWGENVSGWLVALPLTSGPVVFFLALDHGTHFAAGAAVGSLAGTISQAVFCLGYASVALRRKWPWALFGGSCGFALISVLLQGLLLSVHTVFLVAILVLALVSRLLQNVQAGSRTVETPAWDIPARIVLVTAVVFLITSLSRVLGPWLAGLLATFPLFGAVLAIFAHQFQGAESATRVLHGLTVGLFSTAVFFFTVAGQIDRFGIAPAFGSALAAALAIQAASLRFLRRGPAKGVAPK
jgi:uncharacterized membrane protein (GlpM family)